MEKSPKINRQVILFIRDQRVSSKAQTNNFEAPTKSDYWIGPRGEPP